VLAKSDSKTWASIVGFSQQHQQQTRSTPSPISQIKSQHQLPKETNDSDKKFTRIQPPQQEEQPTSFDLFDLNNRAFPPISEASSSVRVDKLVEPKTKVAVASTAIKSNANKKQQYNNYQKQQQISMSKTKTSNTTNGEANTSERTNGSSHYYKRHHPSQPTISSFMTHTDKNLFLNEKSSNSTTENSENTTTDPASTTQTNGSTTSSAKTDDVLDLTQLKVTINPSAYNPKEFNISPKAARFFVIKSYSEDDVHRSIKYNIWCSTEHGNRRLDAAYFRGDTQVPVYLFFSVNGSGHFCGMAEMMSRVDYNKKTDVWSQDKWRGCFQVKWIYVKDVPNSLLRNIKLENNDNKPVTNSRDTQEIPFEKGKQVLKVFHTYNHSSSILDDFEHYERKQEEDHYKHLNTTTNSHHHHASHHHQHHHQASFNQFYNQIGYMNSHHTYLLDPAYMAINSNLMLANNSTSLKVDNNAIHTSATTNTNLSNDTNNENTSLVNSSSSSSSSAMTASTSNTATNTTVSSSTTSSPMSAASSSASSSSSSSSASSVSSSDESKEIEINNNTTTKDPTQQHQPQQLVVS